MTFKDWLRESDKMDDAYITAELLNSAVTRMLEAVSTGKDISILAASDNLNDMKDDILLLIRGYHQDGGTEDNNECWAAFGKTSTVTINLAMLTEEQG